MTAPARFFLVFWYCLVPFFSPAQPAPSLIPYRSGDLWGYADSNGVLVISPQFEEAHPFVHQLEMLSGNYYSEGYNFTWPELSHPVALVKRGGFWGLLDAEGNPLFSPIFRERPNFILAGKGTFWVIGDTGDKTENYDRPMKSALLSLDGQLLTPLIYDNFSDGYDEGDGWGDSDTYGHSSFARWGAGDDAAYLAVRKGRYWGLISVRGEEIIPAIWESVFPGEGGVALVSTGEELLIEGFAGAGQYLAGPGNRIIRKLEPDIENSWTSRHGLFLLRRNGLAGFMDRTGEMVIPFAFTECYGFADGGLAKVRTPDGEWRIIDTKGETLLRLGPSGGCWKTGDIFFIQEADGLWYIYDRQLRKIGSQGFPEPSPYPVSLCGKQYYFQTHPNGHTGLIDTDGQVALPFEYDFRDAPVYQESWTDGRGYAFPLGGFLVQKNGKTGVLDCRFREVVPFIFDNISLYRGPDWLLVQEDGKYGIYDLKKKRLMLPPVFDEIQLYDFSAGFFAVRQGKYWGKYDLHGRELLPVIFERDFFYFNNEAFKLVKSRRGWHVFDKDCREISSFEPMFDGDQATIGVFNEGSQTFTAIIGRVNGKQGLFDLHGKTLVPPDFDYFQIQNDFVFAVKGGKSGVLSYPGLREIVPFEYEGTRYDRGKFRLYSKGSKGFVLFDPETGERSNVQADYSYISNFSEGMGVAHRQCIFGFVDEHFREVIPLQFSYAYNFSEGLAAVKTTGGKWGFINKNGEFAIAPKYLRAESFRDGLAQVEFQNLPDTTIRRALIDHNERELVSVTVGPDANIHRIGKFVVVVAQNYENQTIFDSNGQVVLQHCTCVHADYPETTIQFFCGGNAGLLLPDGSVRSADSLYDLQRFPEGFSSVSFCQAWGLRDSSGRWVIPMGEYNNGSPAEGGKYFMVWRKGLGGICDRKGRSFIPTEYEYISRLGDFWQVGKGGLSGLYDASGRLVVPLKYAQIEPSAMTRLVKATLPNGKVDYYDFKGRGYFSE